MREAGAATSALSQNIDTLSGKLDGLAKRAGQKLLLFGAGGASGIAGVTAAAASLEKQMGTLAATASITDKSFEGYSKSVKSLTKEFPIARGEAISLLTTIDKLGVTTTKQIGEIAKTMVQLHEATGEGLGGLTTGLVELGRQMGTLKAGDMGAFANSLLSVSTAAGVSAQSVIAFSSAIAPAARAAGLSETAVLGISSAFSKAGADGYAAANTFSQMVNDITRQVVTGSPEIAKYANLIGKTSAQFKNMDRGEALIEIFEAINNQGPNAIKTLDQLGYDGVKQLRSIQAVTQSGGLRQGIAEAMGANPGNLGTASAAASDGLYDQLTKTKTAMTDLADTAGKPFLGVFTPVVSMFNELLHVVDALSTPLAHLAAKLSGIATIGATLLGGALVSARIRNLGIGASFLARSAPVQSFRGGMSVGRGGGPNEFSRLEGEGGLRWWQRPGYLAGRGFGQAMGESNGVNYVGRALSSPIRMATGFVRAQTGFVQDARLDGLNRQGSGFLSGIGRTATGLRGVYNDPQAFANRLRGVGTEAVEGPLAMGQTRGQLSGGTSTISEVAAAGQKRAAAAMESVASASVRLAEVKGAEASTGRQVAAAAGGLIRAFIALEAQSSLTGLAIAGKTGLGFARGAGKGALGLVGGPWGAALLGGIAGVGMYKNYREHEHEDYANPYSTGDKYSVALGRATDELGTFASAVKAATAALPKVADKNSLRSISGAVSDLANTPGRKLANADIKNYGTATQRAAFLQSRNLDPQQLQVAEADLVQAFGPSQAQDAIDQYFRNGSKTDYSALVRAGVGKQGEGFKGSIKAGIGIGITNKSKTMFAQPLQDILAQESTDTTKYNAKYAAAAAQNQVLDYLTATNQKGVSKEQSAQAQIAIINAYENKFLGGERVGFDSGRTNDKFTDKNGKITMSDADRRKMWANILLAGDQKGKIQGLGITGQYQSPEELAALRVNEDSPQRKAIKALGGLGTTALNNGLVQSGITNNGDQNAVMKGWQQLLGSSVKMGGSFSQIDARLQSLKGAIGNTADTLYQMADAAQQWNAAQRQNNMQYQTRQQNYSGATANYRSVIGGDHNDPQYSDRLKGAIGEVQQQQSAATGWVRSVTQALHDYGIQSERAEQSYALNRKRQMDSFYLQQKNAADDFHRQQLYSNEDYNRSLARANEDAAKTIYDPMARMYSQYTVDAGTALQNLEDQNQRITQQTATLGKARKMGLSQQAIDTLKLSDPAQAQNLERMVGDMLADPSLIAKINAQVAARLVNTKSLTQSDYNQDYRRQTADFARSTARNEQAYELAVNRANTAFKLGMHNMAVDFGIQKNQAKEDLNNMADEITGSLGSVMAKGIDLIGSKLGAAGGKLTKAFNDIKKNSPELFMTANELLASGLVVTVTATTGATGTVPTLPKNLAPAGSPSGNTSPKSLPDLLLPPGTVANHTTIPTPVPHRSGALHAHTTVDSSTNFTGPVTVAASDPNEMATKLREQARIQKLINPNRL